MNQYKTITDKWNCLRKEYKHKQSKHWSSLRIKTWIFYSFMLKDVLEKQLKERL